jgi:CelD/BcsL family acetyltransferase involved in cellulose biosynthesis
VRDLVPPVASIDCVHPTTDASWLALLKNPDAGLFHSPPWLGVLADVYGFEVRAYVARDASGTPLGGIPFCEIDDIAGHRIVALPFSDSCDPLVPSPGVWTALLTRLQSHRIPVHLRCLRARLIGDEFRVVKRIPSHRVAVASLPEQMWAGLAAPTRRAINKARREGVEIRTLDLKGCEGFYRLHVALRKNKYRLLAQSRAFFDAIANRFSACGGWFLVGAFLHDRLIAATVYLRWGDTLYYKFNASAQDALAVRPNNLLVWAGILLAQSLGCHTLDLGPSDEDQPGLIRFKRNFGASMQEGTFVEWTPPGWRDERGAQARRTLGEMAGLLTAPEVPDDITARAGTLLYSFFA